MAVYRARVVGSNQKLWNLQISIPSLRRSSQPAEGEIEFHAKGRTYAIEYAMMQFGVADSSRIFVYRASGRNNNGNR